MDIPEGTATCGEHLLEQIFLTGLQPVEKPMPEQRKERQSRTVMD